MNKGIEWKENYLRENHFGKWVEKRREIGEK